MTTHIISPTRQTSLKKGVIYTITPFFAYIFNIKII